VTSTGRHPQNFTIRNRIAGLWVTSRQIAVFSGLVRDSGFLEIIPGSAASDGAHAKVQARPEPLEWFNASERMVNINTRVND
jgi:hypothetical protein